MREAPPSQIIHFDSPEAYADWADQTPHQYKRLPQRAFNEPLTTHDSAANMLRTGSMEYIDKAQAIVDQMDVSDLLTDNVRLLESSVAGFMPNVSAYLAGHPETMFDILETDTRSPVSPIKIVVHSSVSAYLSNEDIVRRGIATAALAMAMNIVRPVELYATYCATLNYYRGSNVWGTCVRMPSRPLDLARALWVLTNPAFPRMLGIASMYRIADYPAEQGNDGVPPAFGGEHDPSYYPGMRALLELEPQDILIGRAGSTSGNDALMYSDPVAWVNGMVRKHCHVQAT